MWALVFQYFYIWKHKSHCTKCSLFKWITKLCLLLTRDRSENMSWRLLAICSYNDGYKVRYISFTIPLTTSTSTSKRLYSTQIYKGKAKTCVLHNNVWRPLLRYMHTACIRATKKIIDWMTFILHTIAYDQRNQTSYTDAQNLSQWRTVWIMGHGWFDVKRKYKGSVKSNSVQYKIYKPICRLYEIAGAC